MILRSLVLAALSSLSLYAGDVFYAVSFTSPNSVFGTIDPFTGSFVQIGSAFPGLAHDIAVSPDGTVYSVVDSNLVTIDKSTGVATTVGAVPTNVQSLAFRPDGTLFGASYSDLFSLDPATASGADLGSMGLSASADNIRFDGSGTLYVMSAETDSQLYTVNQTTGAATFIGTSGADDISLGAFLGGAFYGTNQVSGTFDHVVQVNPATGLATEGALTNQIYTFALDPTSVPEPSTFLLLGAGLAVLLTQWGRRGTAV